MFKGNRNASYPLRGEAHWSQGPVAGAAVRHTSLLKGAYLGQSGSEEFSQAQGSVLISWLHFGRAGHD